MRHVPDHHLAPCSVSLGRVEQPGNDALTIAPRLLLSTGFERVVCGLLDGGL